MASPGRTIESTKLAASFPAGRRKSSPSERNVPTASAASRIAEPASAARRGSEVTSQASTSAVAQNDAPMLRGRSRSVLPSE